MKLTPNENVLRVALILFCVLFGILSISLVALGVIYIDELWWPRRFIGLDFIELPTLLIVLGSLSLIMAIAGCFSAKSYNRRKLLIFASFLMIIICLELTIAIIAFINFDEQEKHNIHQIMTNQMNSGNKNDRLIFQELEESYKCCGINGNEDKCNKNSTLYVKINVLDGCFTTVVHKIKIIKLESGYFALIILFLQIFQICCVYFIL